MFILKRTLDGVPAGTPVVPLFDVDENGVWTTEGIAVDVKLPDGSTMIVDFEDIQEIP